jgi:Uri superfamily endonuclease
MKRKNNPSDCAGCYTLVIVLPKSKSIRVGKLGRAFFPAGVYFYTGSAMNGLRARLARHLRKSKKRHWHIDYLLGAPGARVQEVVTRASSNREECGHNQRIARLPGAKIILPGFGSSDCRAGCPSHLIYFTGSPERLAASRKHGRKTNLGRR